MFWKHLSGVMLFMSEHCSRRYPPLRHADATSCMVQRAAFEFHVYPLAGLAAAAAAQAVALDIEGSAHDVAEAAVGFRGTQYWQPDEQAWVAAHLAGSVISGRGWFPR